MTFEVGLNLRFSVPETTSLDDENDCGRDLNVKKHESRQLISNNL